MTKNRFFEVDKAQHYLKNNFMTIGSSLNGSFQFTLREQTETQYNFPRQNSEWG